MIIYMFLCRLGICDVAKKNPFLKFLIDLQSSEFGMQRICGMFRRLLFETSVVLCRNQCYFLLCVVSLRN
jgi:hypothetical protein